MPTVCTRVLIVVLIAFASGVSVRASTATATIGQTVTFTAAADGTLPFSYKWIENAAPISGATAATFVINNVQLSDAGTYSVIVSNSVGAAASDGINRCRHAELLG